MYFFVGKRQTKTANQNTLKWQHFYRVFNKRLGKIALLHSNYGSQIQKGIVTIHAVVIDKSAITNMSRQLEVFMTHIIE